MEIIMLLVKAGLVLTAGAVLVIFVYEKIDAALRHEYWAGRQKEGGHIQGK